MIKKCIYYIHIYTQTSPNENATRHGFGSGRVESYSFFLFSPLPLLAGWATSIPAIVATSTYLKRALTSTGMTGEPTTPRSSPSAGSETCRRTAGGALSWPCRGAQREEAAASSWKKSFSEQLIDKLTTGVTGFYWSSSWVCGIVLFVSKPHGRWLYL